MSIVSIIFRIMAKKGENKEDLRMPPPAGITAHLDLSFTGRNNKYEKLDLYCPTDPKGELPVILNVHGGGWVYGTKDSYKPYCLYLAGQGFAVVNMNYYLASRRKFPFQLSQINEVLRWMQHNAKRYQLNMENVFMVGDSAGGNLVCQYAAILTNPAYAGLFPFTPVKGIRLSAVGLNGGTYEIFPVTKTEKKKKKYCLPKNIEDGNSILQSEEAMQGLMEGLMKDYLGKDAGKNAGRLSAMLDIKGNITSDFPPAFVMTSYHDFLKGQAQPMCNLLRSRGVDAVCRCYGTEADAHMVHVCHTNMRIGEAKQMNLDELAFFREHMAEGREGNV